MSLPGRQIARGNLRLAYTPSRRVPAPLRNLLIVRALVIRLRIAFLNILAVCGALAALLPLLVKRRPLGHRTQVPQPRAARIIPLPQGRRASRP